MIGLYEILNISNNKRYIGSSIHVQERITTHKRNLNNQTHSNKYLQDSWRKYGESSFKFKPILECHVEDLTFYENLIIREYKSNKKEFGYNLREVAESNRGLKVQSKLSFPGDKYHRLTLIQKIDDKYLWLCKCDCGKETIKNVTMLKCGHIKSCGCLRLEKLRAAAPTRKKQQYFPIKLGCVAKRTKYENTQINDLTLLKEELVKNSIPIWSYSCVCGTQGTVPLRYVLRNTFRSCGCKKYKEYI